jgi:hypothetical protein
MASRATRGMASLQDAIEKLSIREKLLLSQAIYEFGSSRWDDVSKLVVSHPLTERPSTFFSPTVRGEFSQLRNALTCSMIYKELQCYVQPPNA